MDGPGDGAEEAEALLQVPDAGAGEGVPVQRLRVQTETLGTGAKFELDGAPGENLVPEPAHEEQEEQPAAAEQQQQRSSPQHQRQPPSPPSSPQFQRGARPRSRGSRDGHQRLRPQRPLRQVTRQSAGHLLGR